MNADFVWQEGLWENRDAGWLTPRLVERLATGMADPRPIPKVDAQGKAVVDVYYSDYARFRKMVHDGTATLHLTVPPKGDDKGPP